MKEEERLAEREKKTKEVEEKERNWNIGADRLENRKSGALQQCFLFN